MDRLPRERLESVDVLFPQEWRPAAVGCWLPAMAGTGPIKRAAPAFQVCQITLASQFATCRRLWSPHTLDGDVHLALRKQAIRRLHKKFEDGIPGCAAIANADSA
jgi:hypothetical protein